MSNVFLPNTMMGTLCYKRVYESSKSLASFQLKMKLVHFLSFTGLVRMMNVIVGLSYQFLQGD